MSFPSIREADRAVTQSRYRLKFAWETLDKTMTFLNQHIEEYRLIQLIALANVDQLFNIQIQNGMETISFTGFTLKTFNISIWLPEKLHNFMLNPHAVGQDKITVVLGGETAYSNCTIKLADAASETNSRSAWKALLIWLETGSLLIGGDFVCFESMSLGELAIAPDAFIDNDALLTISAIEICRQATIFVDSVNELTDNLIRIELALQEIQKRAFRLKLKLCIDAKLLLFMLKNLECIHEHKETFLEAVRLASNIVKRLQYSLLTQEVIRERGVFFQENKEHFSRIRVKPRVEQKKQQIENVQNDSQ